MLSSLVEYSVVSQHFLFCSLTLYLVLVSIWMLGVADSSLVPLNDPKGLNKVIYCFKLCFFNLDTIEGGPT